MELSRGTVTPHRLFSVRDLGLGDPEPYVDRLIKSFLGIGEAVATRWIQMPKAILILQSAPENPASGAIYIYDRQRQEFFMLSFDGPEDNLTLGEFLELLPEYNLLRFAEEPALLQAHSKPLDRRSCSRLPTLEILTEFSIRGTNSLAGEVCNHEFWQAMTL